jgi:ferredoxin
LKKIENSEQEKIIDDKKLTKVIENKEDLKDFWQGISNNCFGCGACTAVCPLCFCTRKDFKNTPDGQTKLCLDWDSCFSKRFSEIQNHHDFRPENVDRLYNWYHHKFVRSPRENNFSLCTGCGRCIDACPANLNVKNIIKAAIEKSTNAKMDH